MMQDDSPLNPVPPRSSAVNEFYKANHLWLDRILFLIVTTIIASVFHVKLDDIGQNVNSTKDVATDTNKTQKAVVAVEVRGEPQDLAALKATTQESK